MDPHRWETIQAAFDELVALDEASRASRLAALATTDPDLRAAVESLLAADAEASGRLAPLDTGFLSEAGTAPDPLGLAGRTISHFEVLEPLGAGGMGVVYRAQDTRLGRAVALKFLLPYYSLDDSAKARFLREARAAAALDHPHLCTIYEVGESEDGQAFLAMPLYTGETLKARLARDGPLPLPEALGITKQMAQGLACAHAAGIVHRDLKPGNVMLLPDGAVKILDFGLAKARDQTASETGKRFGTVAYMAPEQIRGEVVDARADLWAVGVVLYEMLGGRKPFEGEHEVAIAHAIVHDEPAPLATPDGGVPAAVEDVVLTLLQKDPAARYAVVDDLLADLGVGTLDELAAPTGRPRRLRTRYILPARTPWSMAAAAVLVIGAVVYTAIAPGGPHWLRPGSPGSVARYRIALPDTAALAWGGSWHHRIAISPDGDHLVYAGSKDGQYGNSRLWLRRRDQLHATPLPGTDGAINPFFSPDGSRVGFVKAIGNRRAIQVVSLGGGPPTTVTDSLVDFGGGAWGYDGYIYFDGHLEDKGVTRVAETGGMHELVSTAGQGTEKTPGWHFQPEPLPNGKGVLFVDWRGNDASEAEIAVVDLRSRVHRVLVRGGVSPRYARSGHLLYARADGVLMAAPFDQNMMTLTGEPVAVVDGLGPVGGGHDLAVSATGTLVYTTSRVAPRELVWVGRDGRATPIDSAWRAVFTSVALSPDGSALAVGIREAGSTQIWIKGLDRRPASRLTFEGTFNDRPAWTPDGRAVLFVSNSRQNWDLFQRPVDGSALPQLLLDAARHLQDAEYSRDGKWLLYDEYYQLFAARTDGDSVRMALVATGSVQSAPRLSPNGRWLAYASTESESKTEMGRSEVYVRPFPNTENAKWQISSGGGVAPRWSRSGRELFYIGGRGELVGAAVVAGATFAVGEQHVLFSMLDAQFGRGDRMYDVAPDGRFVMIRRPPNPRDELIWVENFFQELKAKVKRPS